MDGASRLGVALAEGDRYLVHALDDGRFEAVVIKDDRGRPYSVTHWGSAEHIRAVCAVDAHPDDRAAIVEVALDVAKYPDDPIKVMEPIVKAPAPVEMIGVAK